MKFFVRAVVTGFGVALGSALFKKVSDQLGLGDKDKAKAKKDETPDVVAEEELADPAVS